MQTTNLAGRTPGKELCPHGFVSDLQTVKRMQPHESVDKELTPYSRFKPFTVAL